MSGSLAWVTGRVPAPTVTLVQRIIGLLAVIRGLEHLRILRSISPEQQLKLPWVSWFPGPSTPWIAVFVGLWIVAAALFAAGISPRYSGSVLALAMVGSVALDQQAYSNHLYLLIVLVALLTLASPGPGTTSQGAPGWPIFLIKAQITVVYVFAALTKINEEWLSGDILNLYLGSGLLQVPSFLVTGAVVKILAVVVIATELAIAAGLWNKTTRPLAFAVGALLHVSILLFMAPFAQLLVFSGEMLAVYVLFTLRPVQHSAALT